MPHRQAKEPTSHVFAPEETELYNTILDLLEDAYRQQARYGVDPLLQQSTREALLLNFAKVMNDCRAILLLVDRGFYIQAGILARSTTDACNMVMHIDVEGDHAPLTRPWLEGRRVTHWMLVDSLKDIQLDMDAYRALRRRLDDFVHANRRALRLYRIQLIDQASLDPTTLEKVTFWRNLVNFYLISCLLAIPMIAPAQGEKADALLEQLLRHLSLLE